MAAEWGFLDAGDDLWMATMRRVLGPGHRGHAAGPLGGLGSVHSLGAWPLGQLQAIIAGHGASEPWLRDIGAHGVRALVAEAQWDGLLPEASDARDGAPSSRPWFAWPGALVASSQLRDRCGTPSGHE